MKFHGIIIEQSLNNKNILDSLNILSTTSGWALYKFEVDEKKVDGVTKLIQSQLKEGNWVHLYGGDKIIVIFKKRTFSITLDRSTWRPAIEYGRSIGIPEEQLDFFPTKFEEEDF